MQAVEVQGHGDTDLSMSRMFNPDLSDAQLRYLPGVLHGSAHSIADTLRHYRDAYSVTHFSVAETRMTALAKVIEQLPLRVVEAFRSRATGHPVWSGPGS